MSETYQIVFLKAGDGSPAAMKTVAQKISTATKTPPEKILHQIESSPFVYKRGLPKAKAEAIAARLNSLGATTQVAPDGAAVATPAAAGAGFGAPADGSGGFDFAGASAGGGASPGGFGGPAPASGMSGGFDFGAPAPRKGFESSDDFSIEQPLPGEIEGNQAAAPSAPAAGGFGGFNFSAEAAVSTPAAPMPVSQVGVERNLDYAEAAKTKAPPPVASRKREETVVCPRCHTEQPPANECANCGVVLAKAGTEAAPAHPAPKRARAHAAVETKKSPVMAIAVGVLLLVVVLAAAFFGGLFNPLRMKLAVSGDPTLKAAGVSVAPPQGGVARAVIGKPDSVKEIQDGYVARAQHVESETTRLGQLADVAEFDRGAQALEADLKSYAESPANQILERVAAVVSPFYRVEGAGITIDNKTYVLKEVYERAGLASDSTVEALPSEVELRRELKAARDSVVQQEAARKGDERRRAANVPFRDGFDAGLGPRWQPGAGLNAQPAAGKLHIVAQPVVLGQAPKLQVPEPLADYTVEVTVSGSAGDTTRGGLSVCQEDGICIAFVKTRDRTGEYAQVMTVGGDGDHKPVGRDVRLRIERKGPSYVFSYSDPARGGWLQMDRLGPAWNEGVPRHIGLVAFGGGSALDLDDFTLSISGQ